MSNSPTPAPAPDVSLDTDLVEAFADRFLAALNGGAMMLGLSIGHRTGLLDRMAGLPPMTSEAIAEAAGLNERYVREWLNAMTTSRVVVHDPADRTYVLPAEHAALLTRASVPNNLASVAQWIAVMGSVETEIVEKFRTGGGVHYCAFDRFHDVMAEESGQTTVSGLVEHILPLVPGLIARLEAGIDVVDVGCGKGRAMAFLAARFPNSRFVGYDFGADAITAGRAEAGDLPNLALEVQDAAAIADVDRFDLITAFDAIHDQARPDLVLANIARALRPGGTFLMQDIHASSHVERNIDEPLGTFTYTISCMHCMTVSLAQGGMGLGAAWGNELALEMLAAAGFGDVRVERLEHDIVNDYYVAQTA